MSLSAEATNRTTGISGSSVISKDLTIDGNMSSEGAIQLEGSVKGEIRCRSLEIMEGGVLDGQVICDTLRVRGKVRGGIDARTVYLDESADVRGDILHGVLNILPGAYLEGRLQRRPAEGAKVPMAAGERKGR
ncbi:MAG: bactofilin family protein [Alphaproteobacteria bacterium]